MFNFLFHEQIHIIVALMLAASAYQLGYAVGRQSREK
jgi:hypothetical protein